MNLFNTEQANCTTLDPELFFPVGEMKPQIESLLCQICMDCAISKQCLEYALEVNVTGYWAGTTHKQRERMRAAKRSLTYRERKREAGKK